MNPPRYVLLEKSLRNFSSWLSCTESVEAELEARRASSFA